MILESTSLNTAAKFQPPSYHLATSP